MIRRAAPLLATLLAACAARHSTASLAAVPPIPAADQPLPPSGVSAHAWAVYRSAYVIDTHNDMPSKMADERYDPDVRHPAGFHAPDSAHTDLPRLVQSGLSAVFMSAFVDASYARQRPDGSLAHALALCDSVHAFVDRHPRQLLFATTAADVRRAKREGKVALLIGVEGGHAIQGSLDNLRTLYAHGARYMTLTWNNGNEWAGSSIGVDGTRTGGLTPFGKEVVREMNRLGMLVDLSHVSDSTFYDAVATSTVPVIASHSSARALNAVPRNLTDDQLRAVARNGGVVNVNFFSRFIDPSYQRAWEAGEAELRRLRPQLEAQYGADTAALQAELRRRSTAMEAALPRTPLSVLIDHVDHVAKVAGVDHVGIGSDFDGVSALPDQMEDVTALPRIAQALLDRGYSDDDVRKMLGGNMLRVMQQVLDARQPTP